MDYLPKDPAILVSSVNMLLRDEEFDSLESLCYAFSREPNALFPVWECFVPKVGIHTQTLVGCHPDNKTTLLRNNPALLQNKRHLSQDLTSFSEKVPVDGRF